MTHALVIGGGMAGPVAAMAMQKAGASATVFETARRGIPIEYGKRLVSISTTDPAGVVAHFADGASIQGDLLIGADGIHSPTRTLIDPTAPEPHFTGLVGLGGFSQLPGIDPTPGYQHFVFGRRAFFGYLVRENGQIYWFANVADPNPPESPRSSPQWRDRLLELFADDLPLISRIINADTSELSAYPIHDIRTSRVWRTNRVVLIGDAAHATSPSSGQGTSMAFEDAVVLARCLRDAPTPAAAFVAYEETRRARVERVVAYSRRLGGTKTAGPVARWFRDLTMPLGLRFAASEKSHAWLYRYHIDWEGPLPT